MVHVLLSAGAAINLTDYKGKIALELATEQEIMFLIPEF